MLRILIATLCPVNACSTILTFPNEPMWTVDDNCCLVNTLIMNIESLLNVQTCLAMQLYQSNIHGMFFSCTHLWWSFFCSQTVKIARFQDSVMHWLVQEDWSSFSTKLMICLWTNTLRTTVSCTEYFQHTSVIDLFFFLHNEIKVPVTLDSCC